MSAREQYAEVLAAHSGCCVRRGMVGNLADVLADIHLTLPDPEQAVREALDKVDENLSATFAATEWNGWDGRHRLIPRIRQAVREARP